MKRLARRLLLVTIALAVLIGCTETALEVAARVGTRLRGVADDGQLLLSKLRSAETWLGEDDSAVLSLADNLSANLPSSAVVDKAVASAKVAVPQLTEDTTKSFALGVACEALDELMAGTEPDPNSIALHQAAILAVPDLEALSLIDTARGVVDELSSGDANTAAARTTLLLACFKAKE